MATIVYRPRHQQQKLTLNGVLIGCTDTCLAMLTDAATLGGVRVDERTVRNLSNERLPDPRSPGLNLDQLVDVSKKLRVQFTDCTGKTAADLRRHLGEDRKAIVQLWYADIGGSNIGHAVLVNYRKREPDGTWSWRVHDPIKTAPEWMPEERVLRAMNRFAGMTGVPSPGLRYGVSRRVPRTVTGYGWNT